MTYQILSEISLERWRQKTVEGWTIYHDDEHCSGEMAQAAACYADPAPEITRVAKETGRKTKVTGAWIPKRWPWATEWYKPKDRRRDLIRAAALIVAEIERLDRAEGRASNSLLDRPEAAYHGSERPNTERPRA
jgi:hypothetical protein